MKELLLSALLFWAPIHAGAQMLNFSTMEQGTGRPVTSKLALAWDFSGMGSTVTVTGVGISNITDGSGNGNSGTQSTDSRRMIYSNTINGRLIGDTNADSTKHLVLPSTITGWTGNGQPPYHMLLLFQVGTWTTGQNVLMFQTGGGSPRSGFRLSTSGGNRIEGRVPTATPGVNTILSNQTTLTTGTTYLAELSVDGGGAASLIVNEGTAATSTSASSGESLTIRRLGDLTSSPNIKVGGAYIFNDALTALELQQWRLFLNRRWAYK